MFQNEQELIFLQIVCIIQIQNIEQASTCAKIHNYDLTLTFLFFLNGKHFYNVFMFDPL